MIFIKFKKYIVVALAVICVLVVSILPCSAVSVPAYDISDDNYNYYIILKDDDGFESVFLSFDKLVVSQESNHYCLYNKNGNVKLIRITNNTSCLFTTPGLLCYISVDEIVSSNYDIKYADSDEVFFLHSPLLERLLNPVQQRVGEKVVRDMAILTVCGIGCLALLISLPVLLKTLHKFLN